MTQRIAKLRIHEERAILRVKENHFFDVVIPLSLASSIYMVCLLYAVKLQRTFILKILIAVRG